MKNLYLISFTVACAILTNCLIVQAIDWNSVRISISNDFELGRYSPFYDDSPGNVKWIIEDLSQPSEADSPAPTPDSGTKYLRATRDADLESGLAVLRSEVLTVAPGDRVSFSFWIRSQRASGNSLELAMLDLNRNETVLVGLSQYSTPTNQEWRNTSVFIPIDNPMDITLAFYGYCGKNLEDAIAIDNVVIDTPPPTTTSSSTTTESTIETIGLSTSTIKSTTSDGFTTTSDTTGTGVTSPQSPCNKDLTTTSGTVTSPNYPSNYDDYADCTTSIQVAPSTAKITLTFTDFYIEPTYDYLVIYDGLEQIPNKLLLNATGYELPKTVTTSGNSCLLRFITDYQYNFRGWSVNYSSA